MCGIVGYVGREECTSILVNALRRLEYRGYDSAGIAVFEGDRLQTVKSKGKIDDGLVKKLHEGKHLTATAGIGHTRWATHGEPSDVNSHPIGNSRITIVHNGIIENYMEIKEELLAKGYTFKSETDTETVTYLIDDNYKNGMSFEDAVFSAVDRIEGTYALGIICKDEPGKLIAVRKGAPLIIGKGEGENFIASDIPAILHHTREVYFVEDNEVAVITENTINIYNKDRQPVHRDIFHVTWDIEAAEKNGFAHFMLKEIHEQPRIVRETILKRMPEDKNFVDLDDIKLGKEELDNIDRIYIVACGTAYYAGLE